MSQIAKNGNKNVHTKFYFVSFWHFSIMLMFISHQTHVFSNCSHLNTVYNRPLPAVPLCCQRTRMDTVCNHILYPLGNSNLEGKGQLCRHGYSVCLLGRCHTLRLRFGWRRFHWGTVSGLWSPVRSSNQPSRYHLV